jgi:polyhydroxyalkanoate synthesis regulator phasin
MATQKTIRVSWETYKKIMDLADARGIAVADAVDYLISKGQAQTQELRERLDYFDSLERELKRYWDENLIEDAWQGWDSLMDLLENQRMYEESLRRHIQKLEGQLKQLQSLLPCSICGKTDGLALNDAWIEFLREQMKKAGWGHSNCINRSKR